MDESKWLRLKFLTSEIQSCQTGAGITKKSERVEAEALERQRQEVQRSISNDASEFLKKHGFTSTGQKRKKR